MQGAWWVVSDEVDQTSVAQCSHSAAQLIPCCEMGPKKCLLGPRSKNTCVVSMTIWTRRVLCISTGVRWILPDTMSLLTFVSKKTLVVLPVLSAQDLAYLS